jgi:hypothetical protein
VSTLIWDFSPLPREIWGNLEYKDYIAFHDLFNK